MKHNDIEYSATPYGDVIRYDGGTMGGVFCRMHPEPYHMVFTFGDGATATLTMTRDEAVTIFEALGVALRFEETPASEIDVDHWTDCHKDMRRAITPVCRHDWEDGFSMNGPTRTCRKCGKFERD